MTECPICKENPGTYYRCFARPLARILGRFPAIVDSVHLWHLLASPPEDPIPLPSRSEVREFVYQNQGRLLRNLESLNRPSDYYYFIDDPTFQNLLNFIRIHNEQDDILIFMCPACTLDIRESLGLDHFELVQLFAHECPCCGYYTLEHRGRFEHCPVCFWEDDGQDELDQVSGPNNITLREARENFRLYRAKREWNDLVREPRMEEHPRFYRYFG